MAKPAVALRVQRRVRRHRLLSARGSPRTVRADLMGCYASRVFCAAFVPRRRTNFTRNKSKRQTAAKIPPAIIKGTPTSPYATPAWAGRKPTNIQLIGPNTRPISAIKSRVFSIGLRGSTYVCFCLRLPGKDSTGLQAAPSKTAPQFAHPAAAGLTGNSQLGQ